MSAANIVDHVQSILTPRDRMPPPFRPREQTPAVDNPRPEPPDWIGGSGDDDLPWEPDEEIALPPAGGTEIPVETSDVASNPDVHAYYLPFHFYRRRWGIYIRARSIVKLTALLQGRSSLVGDEWDHVTARAAFRMLVEHETFHHLTELAISRLEAVALEYMSGDSLYGWNFWRLHSVNIEEGMANAYALQELQRATEPLRYAVRSVTLGRVASFMEKQPAGYRDFEQYLGNPRFLNGKDQIIAGAKACSPRLGSRGGSDGVLLGRVHFVEKERPSICPIRLVIEPGVPIARIRPFPKDQGMQVYVYTRNEHPPPHFHLFLPPGRERGCYGWPGLEPVGDSPKLAGKEEGRLRQYIRGCQPKIYEKIRAVYPGVPNIE